MTERKPAKRLLDRLTPGLAERKARQVAEERPADMTGALPSDFPLPTLEALDAAIRDGEARLTAASDERERKSRTIENVIINI